MVRTTRLVRMALAAVALAVAGAGCGGESSPPVSAEPSGSASSSDIPAEVTRPVDDILVKEYDVDLGPDWMAVDEHGLWVMRDRAPSLLIDPASGELLGTVDAGWELPLCQGIGAGYGAVYICRGTDLMRIDIATMKVQERVKLHKEYAQGHIPAAFGRFWVLEGDGSTLTGLDPGTGKVVSHYTLPARGWDMTAGPDGLWVACKIDGQVLEVDPDTGEVLLTATVQNPEYVAVGDQVWVAGSSQTFQVDPETGALLATFDGGAEPTGDLALDDRYVWIRNADDFLMRIDQTTGAVVRYTSDLVTGGGVAVAGGDVWLTTVDEQTLLRLHAET